MATLFVGWCWDRLGAENGEAQPSRLKCVIDLRMFDGNTLDKWIIEKSTGEGGFSEVPLDFHYMIIII